MTATITVKIEYEIDGKRPSKKVLDKTFLGLISTPGCIGSQEIDGTDTWGLDLGSIAVEVELGEEGADGDK